MPVNKPILIGLYGKARSGKDTAAAHLADKLKLHQYSFAEPLKTMLKSVFGDHFHEGDRSGICPETGQTYRHMMQTLGTEWGRQLMTPNIWVNLVDRRWQHVRKRMGFPDAQGMVLSDIRFDSEAEWLIANGGYIIEIQRPGVAIAESSHASEAGLHVGIPRHVIQNDAGLDELYLQLADVVDVIAHHHGAEVNKPGESPLPQGIYSTMVG